MHIGEELVSNNLIMRMKTIIRKYIVPIVCSAMLIVTVSSCSKDKYYKDGGLANPNFNGTMLQYLQSKPQFDTIAQIVKLAGMEDVFSKENITFFAPTDEVIRRTIGLVNSTDQYLAFGLNEMLFTLHKDTIKQLSDIPGPIWKKYLMRYMFKGSYYLKDYPQLDFNLRPLYPGGYYYGYNGSDLSNIGVVFYTANTVKYSGYRQLCITSVTDPSNPSYFYGGAAAVASSDIHPTNGVVHTLAVWYPGASDPKSNPNTTGELRMNETMMDQFGMSFDFSDEVILSR
ncbi:fasciclin domain-containing protein [Mucilaginibacter panaciglaebae]|uniref:Fasciclin domain-containing protein n=2 Tax=Mucilaginibacter panaciglaebae TaxID=502331 RepID=A0ABP7X5Y7_9SPHI